MVAGSNSSKLRTNFLISVQKAVFSELSAGCGGLPNPPGLPTGGGEGWAEPLLPVNRMTHRLIAINF